ncbi:LEAF RUST 10 DISEASE-RESISTANCE LOCUS RECEPTOR-LIKE PROTEIN KINASE-like 1.1 [Prosopis cineraria]|uniref:LEAF RUST 10 DISEASE-RESISTANCE LOCUS RECEPTOR-LIKE PROTEIN KINASE-like 1.1 n=1 Tax=Prosopis cineraria TaxID=364024 RepID=UPI00240FA6BB|nr:LEAF RUST 10 DISEASE-RESISTANCE LOCUS RECEPTOR-LIKE PROTEIN KINASE-like 1.1 [Prosopis cineraria]
MRGCGNSSSHKEVQLGNKRWFQIGNMSQKDHEYELIVHDLKFRELLDSKTCSVFDYQVPVPPESPPLFFSFLNLPLLRCSGTPYEYRNVSHHSCSDYYIFFSPLNIAGDKPIPSNACSTIQLPLNPQSLDLDSKPRDPLELLTAEIHIEVRLSKSCIECHYFRGGQCLADGKCSAKEHKGMDSKALITGVAIGSAGLTIIGLFIILLVKGQGYRCSGFVNQSSTVYFDMHPCTNPECVTVDVGVPIFDYEELEKATNNFDPSQELGRGGFGIVSYGTGSCCEAPI